MVGMEEVRRGHSCHFLLLLRRRGRLAAEASTFQTANEEENEEGLERKRCV